MRSASTRKSWVMRMEQNLGPHMEQKCATLCASFGRVSSWKLRATSVRDVLLRLQNNLKTRRLRQNDLPGALACAEDMLRIAPDHSALWRETALINQRLDRVGAALRCFERFLKLVPQGEAASRARAAMDELRSRLN